MFNFINNLKRRKGKSLGINAKEENLKARAISRNSHCCSYCAFFYSSLVFHTHKWMPSEDNHSQKLFLYIKTKIAKKLLQY